MFTPVTTRILVLGLAFTATASQADDFMLGAGRSMAVTEGRSDCDTVASQPVSGVDAQVIYHDGRQTPVSVPVHIPGGAVSDVSEPSERTSASTSGGGSVRGGGSLPSAEPTVPQKRGGGLRWQSVLPGAIK
ncbi:hypothetical protein [Tahibacter amnicola]|uniref:Uncharacterized protein n=1 Tax=Tahibacter amnicola TaxID=2976241 RepID=A0ABY6BFS1_9GAMM|nr:hypothetical protein [Tahibacter amnicola]UXI67940.1 hypothetical protein N4264_24970 [Tahibacter amnicola]